MWGMGIRSPSFIDVLTFCEKHVPSMSLFILVGGRVHMAIIVYQEVEPPKIFIIT